MMSFNLSLNEEQLKLVKDALKHLPASMNKAVARAINRAVEGARTDAVKCVCAEYTIKPKDVRKSILIIRANPGKLEAQIISTGEPIPLIKFKVRPQTPPAKNVKIPSRKKIVAGVKFGVAKEMPLSFIAVMKNGHKGVFERKENAGRIPIKQHYSPSVPQMIGNMKVLDYIEVRARERLDKELWHQVKYLFGGGK